MSDSAQRNEDRNYADYRAEIERLTRERDAARAERDIAMQASELPIRALDERGKLLLAKLVRYAREKANAATERASKAEADAAALRDVAKIVCFEGLHRGTDLIPSEQLRETLILFRALLDKPHPGAPLLEELERLREVWKTAYPLQRLADGAALHAEIDERDATIALLKGELEAAETRSGIDNVIAQYEAQIEAEEATIAELRRQMKERERLSADQFRRTRQLEDEHAKRGRQLRRARKALSIYGAHVPGCGATELDKEPCSCGFAAALADPPAGEEGAK